MNSKVTAWLARPTTTMLVVLLSIVAIFAALSPGTFFTFSNAQGILSNAAILLVVAVGATFVILTAGIDLSVGSVLVFSSVVGAKAMEQVGGQSLGTILVGLAVTIIAGALWGALNGVLI
ncbi:MAG TPA: ABC transporter permease, partial [Dermatophilaceae bacterium]|nr:ABC transporter permease [Dermatophilaceae bacterium]